MSFKEGEEAQECPECDDGTMMVYEISFYDTGTPDNHRTVDYLISVCPKCDHYIPYEEDNDNGGDGDDD